MNKIHNPSQMAEMATRLERLEGLALAPNMSPPPWTDASARPADDYRNRQLDRAEAPALRRARSSRGSGISPWLFVMATALNTMVAAILAVIITLGVVRQEQADASHRDAAAGTVSGLGGDPIPAATQPLDLRPIGSPEQPLRLQPHQPARLPLLLAPDAATRETFILGLSGVPAATTLSGATRIGSDTWLLPPGSANLVKITMPEWSTSVYELAVELRHTNGMVAARTKGWIAVPPPQGQETAPINDEEAKDLLAKADQLLAKGNIAAARSMYQRGAEMGNATAALALGATYDPNRLWSLGILGMVGNKARAKQWYVRADELGHPDAKARIKALGN